MHVLVANKAIHDTFLSLKNMKKGDIEKSVLGYSISHYWWPTIIIVWTNTSFYKKVEWNIWGPNHNKNIEIIAGIEMS